MYIAPPIFDARKSGLSFAKRTYLPRVAGLGLGFICVCAALYPLAPPTAVWLLLAFHGFVWPHLAYHRACRAKDPFKAEIRNLLIDSAFGGFWAAMMAFNALPAIVILSMMSMNNIASAGKALFVKGLAIQLAVAALTGALLGFPFHPHSTPLQIYLCLPMIYLYPTLLGLVTYRTAKRLAEKKQELQRISTRDGLTGLYNRRHWEHLLHRQFDSCRRYQDNATLILMDIDRFKTINDTFGHALGDEALAALAEELLIGLRRIWRGAAEHQCRTGGNRSAPYPAAAGRGHFQGGAAAAAANQRRHRQLPPHAGRLSGLAQSRRRRALPGEA
jgi:diguanylate cyclase